MGFSSQPSEYFGESDGSTSSTAFNVVTYPLRATKDLVVEGIKATKHFREEIPYGISALYAGLAKVGKAGSNVVAGARSMMEKVGILESDELNLTVDERDL